MITCPNCHKPVSGRARSCGYCGISIVEDYFSASAKSTEQYPAVRGGTLAATVLGVFAAVAVLMSAGMQLLLVLQGSAVVADALFWVRVVAMVFLAVLFLAQQLVLHGLRFSLLFDSLWLFVSACGAGFAVWGFVSNGKSAFYGSMAVAFLFLTGGTLAVSSCITGILAYRRPE